MSELADLLIARADEEFQATISRDIQRDGLDPDDPELRQLMEDTLWYKLGELNLAAYYLGITVLDALPLVGPWMLRQLANRPD